MAVRRTNSAKPTVLYLDDKPVNSTAFHAVFSKEFKVLRAADLNRAWAHLEAHEVQVVICNQHMAGLTGIEALQQIKQRFPKVRRLLITAHADLYALVDALNRAEVCRYIEKPWDAEHVREAIREACQQYQEAYDQAARTEQLLESNRQLEFALRQFLLS